MDGYGNIIDAEGSFTYDDGSVSTFAQVMFAEAADVTVASAPGDDGGTVVGNEITLSGEPGVADTFILDPDSGFNTILDFESGIDSLDLAGLLDANFDPQVNQSDYISTRVEESQTIVSIDGDGVANGSGFTDVAALDGVGAGDTIKAVFDDQGGTTPVIVA